jgi:hypothetical protein
MPTPTSPKTSTTAAAVPSAAATTAPTTGLPGAGVGPGGPPPPAGSGGGTAAATTFKVGTVITTPTAVLSAAVDTGLPSGTHVFQLVVVDEDGNQSDPVTAQIVIKDTQKPTAVINVTPTQVQPGQVFTLDGSKSSDVAPGKVVSFIWTMVS